MPLGASLDALLCPAFVYDWILDAFTAPRAVSSLRISEPHTLGAMVQGVVTLYIARPYTLPDYRDGLGMPRDVPLMGVAWLSPPSWGGYGYAIQGTPLDTTPGIPATAPLFHLLVGGFGGQHIPLVAWRRTVCCPGIPGHLEAWWHPDTGVRLDVCGVEALSPAKVAELCQKGQQLLHQVERRGRPVGSTDINEATFRQQYLDAYRRLQAQGIRRPSQEKVAAQLLIHKRTFERYLKHYRLPWPPT
jgi:hypothetical protein